MSLEHTESYNTLNHFAVGHGPRKLARNPEGRSFYCIANVVSVMVKVKTEFSLPPKKLTLSEIVELQVGQVSYINTTPLFHVFFLSRDAG